MAGSLLALLVVATVLLHSRTGSPGQTQHLGILDSLYFAVETVATVGYGDYTFSHQPAWMMACGIVLIVAGVALVSTAFALVHEHLGQPAHRALPRSPAGAGMTDHVIVIGLGSVGISVVRGLVSEGQRVVVIERDTDNRYLAQARALGVPVVSLTPPRCRRTTW